MKFTETELQKQSGYNGYIKVEFKGDVGVIQMRCGENRLNYTFINKLNTALDEVERNPNTKAVVLTGNENFFSNGMDVNWGAYVQQNKTTLDIKQFHYRLNTLLLRILTFPIPVIAAINGHAFAGGGILALSCDVRIMNSERGWFCLNEIHIKIPFDDFMSQLLHFKLPSGMVFHETAVLGKRFTAQEALKSGIVSSICDAKTLLTSAIALAEDITKHGAYHRLTLHNMKASVYNTVKKAAETALTTDTNEAEIAWKAKL